MQVVVESRRDPRSDPPAPVRDYPECSRVVSYRSETPEPTAAFLRALIAAVCSSGRPSNSNDGAACEYISE